MTGFYPCPWLYLTVNTCLLILAFKIYYDINTCAQQTESKSMEAWRVNIENLSSHLILIVPHLIGTSGALLVTWAPTNRNYKLSLLSIVLVTPFHIAFVLPIQLHITLWCENMALFFFLAAKINTAVMCMYHCFCVSVK